MQTADADQTLTNALLTGQGQDTLTAVENASLTGGAAANILTATGFTLGGVTLDGQAQRHAHTRRVGSQLRLARGSGRHRPGVQSRDANLTLTDAQLAHSAPTPTASPASSRRR